MAELDDLMHELHERESRKAFGAWFQEKYGYEYPFDEKYGREYPKDAQWEAWKAGERYGRRGNSSLREKSIRIV